MSAAISEEREGYRPSVMSIREMDTADLREVIEIERKSFRTPWSDTLFLEELNSPFCHSFVAVIGDVVAGSIHFAIILDEIHLRNVAVHPAFRRAGIATALMEKMIEFSDAKGAFQGFLEVRRSNRPALGLYEKFGFGKRGIRPLYYSDTCEDAFIMTADFSSKIRGKKSRRT